LPVTPTSVIFLAVFLASRPQADRPAPQVAPPIASGALSLACKLHYVGLFKKTFRQEKCVMGLLEVAIVALIVALVAGALGFTGVASGAAMVAKVTFGIFLLIALVLFVLVLLGITAFT
jgi:uncharacterized membrane protein YtjA (UPF0391 family)